MLEELFFEIGMIIAVAGGLAMLMHVLRQPLILAYLVAGILVGPGFFAIAGESEVFEVMSQIGIAFLLFTVGLGLNWRVVKNVGGISLATGIGQVLFTALIGFPILQALGFSLMTSAYLSVALAFSSTIIIVKLLSDKDEMDTLYGRISVGFLLVQDFIALLILLGLDTLRTGLSLNHLLVSTLAKGALLIPVLWLISRFIVPRIVAYAARSQELLFIFSIAWAFLVAGILAALGFGIEFGSLVAGILLSGTVYEKEINARIRPLRDFFLIIFFIVLGMQLTLSSIPGMMLDVVVLSSFILIGNPLIVLFIMRLLGYHPRTGFLAGTTVAQISEFSFIVIAAGIGFGHVDPSAMGLITMVGLITFAGSAYLISGNERIYQFVRPLLRWLEPKEEKGGKMRHRAPSQIVLFGSHRLGTHLLESLRRMKKPYLVVDYDPAVVRDLAQAGIPVVYGDVGDELFLSELNIQKARLLISTIPNVTISLSLLNFLKHRAFKGSVIVSARSREEAAQCYQEGATYVIVPHMLGGERFRDILEEQKTATGSWKKVGAKAREILGA